MRYNVFGKEKPRDGVLGGIRRGPLFVVEANSEEEAIKEAERRGVIVDKVEIEGEANAKNDAETPVNTTPQSKPRHLKSWMVVTLILGALVGAVELSFLVNQSQEGSKPLSILGLIVAPSALSIFVAMLIWHNLSRGADTPPERSSMIQWWIGVTIGGCICLSVFGVIDLIWSGPLNDLPVLAAIVGGIMGLISFSAWPAIIAYRSSRME